MSPECRSVVSVLHAVPWRIPPSKQYFCDPCSSSYTEQQAKRATLYCGVYPSRKRLDRKPSRGGRDERDERVDIVMVSPSQCVRQSLAVTFPHEPPCDLSNANASGVSRVLFFAVCFPECQKENRPKQKNSKYITPAPRGAANGPSGLGRNITSLISCCSCQMRTESEMPCLRSDRKGRNRIEDRAAGSSMGRQGAACERYRLLETAPRSGDHQEAQSSRARRWTLVVARLCRPDLGMDRVRECLEDRWDRPSYRLRHRTPVLYSRIKPRTGKVL
jgi:hypothetical protein